MKQEEGVPLNILADRISLDFRADAPIYLQIVHQIESLVTDCL